MERPSTPTRQPLQGVTNTTGSSPTQFHTPRRRKAPSASHTSKPWPRYGQFVPLETISAVTKKIFGYQPMPWQMDLFKKMAEGCDTFAIAGTGYGKSLVFALAAIAADLSRKKGLMLVICPLKSLEQDQVRRFNMAEPVLLADNRRVKITAVVVNEDNKDKSVFTQLAQGAYRLCYASPECLLHNPNFKQLFRRQNFRDQLVGIAVDEAHLIESWKDDFRKDYGELETLKVITGIEIPWMALTATCSTRTFETIYITLGMGGTRPFWGIDMGSNRANLALWVRPMEYSISSMADLFAFIPENPQSAADFEKTIFYFKSRAQAQSALEKIQALLPSKLTNAMQLFTATSSNNHKEATTEDFRLGSIRWLFATMALGVGLDVPDVKSVVVFGVTGLNEAFQQGGRAGRDKLIAAKWVWIVEPWALKSEAGQRQGEGKKQEQKSSEKRMKLDEASRTYINLSQSNRCMREFLCTHFHPQPNLPGFRWYTGAADLEDVSVEWVVKPEVITSGIKCGCSAKCCRPNPAIPTGILTTHDHTRIQHHLNKRLQPQPQMATYSSQPQLRCSQAERDALEIGLYTWRDQQWSQLAATHPFLCADWVISDQGISRLVEKAHIFLNTDSINSQLLSGILSWMTTPQKTASLIQLLEEFRKERLAREQRDATKHLRKQPRMVTSENNPLTDGLDTASSTQLYHSVGAFTGQIQLSTPAAHQPPSTTPTSMAQHLSQWQITGYQ